MTEESSTAEAFEPQDFGWQHIAALAFAVTVTVLIFSFRNQIADLQELAYLGAFLVALVANATVILPVPGLVIIFSLGGSGLIPLFVGMAAGAGAALGELSGFAAGYGSSAVLDDNKIYARIKGWMNEYGLIVISGLAAVPNPFFDMAGLAAGAMRIKWWKFLIAAWIGKTIQGVLLAYAGALSLGWVEQLIAR